MTRGTPVIPASACPILGLPCDFKGNLGTPTLFSLLSVPSGLWSFMSWSLGKRAVVGYEDGTIRIWDLKQGSPIHVLKGTRGGRVLTWAWGA